MTADSRYLCIVLNTDLFSASLNWALIFYLVSSVGASQRWLPHSSLRSTARAGVPVSSRKGQTSAVSIRTARLAPHSIIFCSPWAAHTFYHSEVSYQLADLPFYRVPKDSLTGQPEVMSVLTQTASWLRNVACSCFTVVVLWFEKNFLQSGVF